MTSTCTITAAHGRNFIAESPEGERFQCLTRGKKRDLACGDRVEIHPLANGQAVIECALERTSVLFRSDAFKQKVIAANVTQIVIVVAGLPPFSDEVLARCLVAAEAQQIGAVIVLNKCDLADIAESVAARIAPFAKLGYPVVPLVAIDSADALLPLLRGHANVLVGESGMGKSTLINQLVPGARASIGEISVALNTGRHTTTHATLYRLAADTTIIDSPGLQAFGLAHLDRADLERGFVDFRPYLGQCRFRDCAHRHEPDCAVLAAVDCGALESRRLALFHSILGAP